MSAVIVAFHFYVSCGSFPEELLHKGDFASKMIVDRNGVLLREVLSDREGRSRWVEHNEFSPHLINATIAVEDKRFYEHHGVDFLAIGRAAWNNLRYRRIVSGASTLTQQLVRILRPRQRTFISKADEAVLAMRLEKRLSKQEILTYYLNRAPYGNQLFGAQSAAQVYFSKPVHDLSIAEAAFLAGLPQAPSRYNPYRHMNRATTRQKQVLYRMLTNRIITQQEYERALNEKLNIVPKKHAFRAPHFVNYVLRQLPSDYSGSLVRTTLDLRLQKTVEEIVAAAVRRLEKHNVTNASVVILDNINAEILAMVGSADFFDNSIQGQVNGALSIRQPGSALKPFAYAMAFESGLNPSSVIPDVPCTYGSGAGAYAPSNYDGRAYGPVRARLALANSLNLPAVRILNDFGLHFFWSKLKDLGFKHVTNTPLEYGLGLALGNAGVELIEIAAAYSTFARNGSYTIPAAFQDSRNRLKHDVYSKETCFMISEILADRNSSHMAFGRSGVFVFPYPVAVKTGTSHDYRDNWAIGYTPEHTVAVWVGNFDCEPLRHSSGITGAGPILRDIAHVLYKDSKPSWFRCPAEVEEYCICALSGQKAGPHCPKTVREYFKKNNVPEETCKIHDRNGCEVFKHLGSEYAQWLNEQEINMPLGEPEDSLIVLSPCDKEVIVIDPDCDKKYQTLLLSSNCPADLEVTWYVNGCKYTATSTRNVRWQVQPGTHTFSARDSLGRISKTVTIYVE